MWRAPTFLAGRPEFAVPEGNDKIKKSVMISDQRLEMSRQREAERTLINTFNANRGHYRK